MENLKREELRRDIQEQFELPDTPAPMTRRRSLDFKQCRDCPFEHDGCDRWKDVPSAFGL